MEQSWALTVGRLTLYFFYVFVGTTLLGIAVGRGFRRSRAGSKAAGRSRLLRLFVEYVGNTGFEEADGAGVADRRHNREARFLMEHIKKEMARREVPPPERERLVAQLREAVRAEGSKRTG